MPIGSLTSSQLIASIKSRAMIPQNQVTFANEDFLRFCTEEVQHSMFAEILRAHEDFFLYKIEIPLVGGQSEYKIPPRAGGIRLREVAFKDGNGNYHEMTRIEVQDIPYYNNNNVGNNLSAFYIQNNKVCLQPPLTITAPSGSLVMYFYMRPNDIVEESRAATISSINTTTGEITVDEIPTDSSDVVLFSTITKLDFISIESPHVTVGYDILPTSVTTSTATIVFDPDDLPSDLQVGDYINLAGESIVPQIPADLHMQLAMRVALRCMSAMGDQQAYQIAKDELQEAQKHTTAIIDNRVEGSPRKIVNRHGSLRDGLFRRRFRYRGY